MKISLRSFSKHFQRIALISIAALLLSTSISHIFTPQKVYAATGDQIDAQLEQEYKSWAAFVYVSHCLNSAKPTISKLNYTNPDWTNGNDSVEVGLILEPDDGELDCSVNSDMLIGLKNVGYDSIAQFVDEFYPRSGSSSKCQDNECQRIAQSAMRDKISEKIRSKGWAGPTGDGGAVTVLSNATKYWFWKRIMKSPCGGNSYEKETDTGFVNASDTKRNEASNEKIASDGGYVITRADLEVVRRPYWTFTLEDDDGIKELGTKLTVNPYTVDTGQDMDALNCIQVASQLKQDIANAYRDLFVKAADECAAKGTDRATCITEAGNSAANVNLTPETLGDDNSCDAKGGELGFIMCPLLTIIGSALNWVDTQLSRLLEIDRDKYTSPEMYATWVQFRNIGLTILIAAMLVMVISTALGIGALDAYTVKKAFPRMVAAVIFVLLSWYFCILLIDVANVIGKGTLGIMTSPFQGKAESLTTLFNPSVGGAVTQGSIAIGGGLLIGASVFGIIPGALPILLSWLGTGLLIMGVAFLVLVARQMFVVVLILFGPIAILSWIFPGNDKLWKFWWQSFSKLLLMFPMIMALIASGRIFAGVIANTTSAGAEGSLLNPLLKLTAYVIPYAFIPFTFKAAGGVFGNLVGMANDRSRGAFDRLKKSRQKNMGEVGTRMAAGVGFKGSQNSALNKFASGVAAGPRNWVGRGAKGRRAAVKNARFNNYGEKSFKENDVIASNQNNDMFQLAMMDEQMALEAIADADARSKDTSKSDYERGAARQEVFARQAALDAARSISNKSPAMRRQAALNLAASGYQFAPGVQGLEQLDRVSRELFGSEEGARSAFMNSVQYNAKGAGRPDMGGLNNGSTAARRESVKSGIRKLRSYERSGGKTDLYIGGADAWLGDGVMTEDGKTVDETAMSAAMSQNLASGQISLDDIAAYHEILVSDEATASDANKIEIRKQIAAIENMRPPTGGSSPSTMSPEVQEYYERLRANRTRVNPRDGIDPSEIT